MRKSECVRESECMHVCMNVCERERVSVFVCVCLFVRDSECVYVRERVFEYVCVCLCVRERVCMCV